MKRAITINLDRDVVAKLRIIQAAKIKKNKRWISFSKIVNQTIKDHFTDYGPS